jgi:hypothetical protein
MMKPTVVALLCLVARSSLALVAPVRVSPQSVRPINQRGLALRLIASDKHEHDTPVARFFGVMATAAIIALSNPLEARADLFNGTFLQERNPTGIKLLSFSPKRFCADLVDSPIGIVFGLRSGANQGPGHVVTEL